MPSSKSSLDKRDVYYRKGKSDGECMRSGAKAAAAGSCRSSGDDVVQVRHLATARLLYCQASLENPLSCLDNADDRLPCSICLQASASR